MPKRWWKYYVDVHENKAVLIRHWAYGNNPNHLKIKRNLPNRTENVKEFKVKVPYEEFESFRTVYDWGALQSSDREFKVSLGKQKRLNQWICNLIRERILSKYPPEFLEEI